jgi:streptogramin lyase
VRTGRSAALGIGLLVALVTAQSASAAPITEFDANPGTIGAYPLDIVSGPEGNLWWTEAGLETGLMRMSPSGERFAIIPTAEQPTDLVVAPSGWVSWTSVNGFGYRSPGGVVKEQPTSDVGGPIILNPSNEIRWGRKGSIGGESSICHGTKDNAFEGVEGCAVAGNGPVTGLAASTQKLWASYIDENVVRIFDAGVSTYKPVELPIGSGPGEIAIGPEGDAWVVMVEASAVDRIAPDGTRTRFPLPAGSEPNGITLGPDGALWVTEFETNKIVRMTSGGAVTAEYPVPSAGAELGSITVGPDGALWFTEPGVGKIGRLAPEPPPPSGDTVAPRFLGKPAFSPSRFKVAGKGRARASAKGAAPTGTKLEFSLSEAAKVTATIARKVVRHKKARYVKVGALVSNGKQGANKVSFSGKLKGKRLAPGRYRATLTARDAAGNTSAPKRASFTVVG